MSYEVQWTTKMAATVIACRQLGRTWSYISKRVGVAPHTARKKATRLGLPVEIADGPRGFRPHWTPEQIKALQRGKAEGKTYAEIGRELGFNRNAVMCQWHRLQRKAA